MVSPTALEHLEPSVNAPNHPDRAYLGQRPSSFQLGEKGRAAQMSQPLPKPSIWLRTFLFPLLVLKGIDFTTGHVFSVFPGAEKANGDFRNLCSATRTSLTGRRSRSFESKFR